MSRALGFAPRPLALGDLPATLRPARPRDASGILTLERALTEDGAGMVRDLDDLPRDEAAVRRMLRPFLDGPSAPPNGIYLVVAAERGGTWPILASGELRRLAPARVRHVGALALGVHPGLRRRGLGGAVLEALVGFAEAHRFFRLELEVRADNGPARALYARFDFVEEGRRRGFVRLPDGRFVDDVMMARYLGPLGGTIAADPSADPEGDDQLKRE